MFIGELIRIYEKKELLINPVYQRSFRWDESRKTRFVESLILGILIPPYLSLPMNMGDGSLLTVFNGCLQFFNLLGCYENQKAMH